MVNQEKTEKIKYPIRLIFQSINHNIEALSIYFKLQAKGGKPTPLGVGWIA